MRKFDRAAEPLFLWKRYGLALVDDNEPDILGWRVEWDKSRRRPVVWMSPSLFFKLEPKIKSWVKSVDKALLRAAAR